MKTINNRTASGFIAFALVVSMFSLSLPGVSARPLFTVPDAPYGLTMGSLAVFDTYLSIGVSWIDNSSNETGFRIERKQGVGGTYSVVATASANVTSIGGITMPRDGNTYLFRVKAYNSDGESAVSNEIAIDTDTAEQVPPPMPNAPTSFALSGTSVFSTYLSLGFTWTDNSSDETGFRIEKKQGVNGTYSVVASPGANTTSYGGITIPRDGNTYYFRIKSYNANGESSPSNEVSVYAQP